MLNHWHLDVLVALDSLCMTAWSLHEKRSSSSWQEASQFAWWLLLKGATTLGNLLKAPAPSRICRFILEIWLNTATLHQPDHTGVWSRQWSHWGVYLSLTCRGSSRCMEDSLGKRGKSTNKGFWLNSMGLQLLALAFPRDCGVISEPTCLESHSR